MLLERPWSIITPPGDTSSSTFTSPCPLIHKIEDDAENPEIIRTVGVGYQAITPSDVRPCSIVAAVRSRHVSSRVPSLRGTWSLVLPVGLRP